MYAYIFVFLTLKKWDTFQTRFMQKKKKIMWKGRCLISKKSYHSSNFLKKMESMKRKTERTKRKSFYLMDVWHFFVQSGNLFFLFPSTCIQPYKRHYVLQNLYFAFYFFKLYKWFCRSKAKQFFSVFFKSHFNLSKIKMSFHFTCCMVDYFFFLYPTLLTSFFLIFWVRHPVILFLFIYFYAYVSKVSSRK